MHYRPGNVIIDHMEQVAAGNKAVDRIKSVFLLGLSSNFTTLVGLVMVWIILSRNDWVYGFWETAFTILAFAPVFMGDAINHYCLGRIRLEHYKGWDDIQVTSEGRIRVAHYYYIFRMVSVLPAYLLAGVFISSFGPEVATRTFMKQAFLAAFILNFFRATWFLKSCIAPRLPGYGGKKLFIRTFLAALAFSGWFLYMWMTPGAPYSKSFIFISGFFYFFLNAFLQPLPTRYSLLRPGKASRREAYFSVEVIEDEQLESLDNAVKINATTAEFITGFKFEKLKNIRLPLIELPLFQAWGTISCDPEGKIGLLVLDSEVKRGVHRSMVSYSGENIFITTDFGAPQAKFPANVKYQGLEKNITHEKMLEAHAKFTSECDMENVKSAICVKLEKFVKNMIKFLETDATAKRLQAMAEKSKSTNNLSGDIKQ